MIASIINTCPKPMESSKEELFKSSSRLLFISNKFFQNLDFLMYLYRSWGGINLVLFNRTRDEDFIFSKIYKKGCVWKCLAD